MTQEAQAGTTRHKRHRLVPKAQEAQTGTTGTGCYHMTQEALAGTGALRSFGHIRRYKIRRDFFSADTFDQIRRDFLDCLRLLPD